MTDKPVAPPGTPVPPQRCPVCVGDGFVVREGETVGEHWVMATEPCEVCGGTGRI